MQISKETAKVKQAPVESLQEAKKEHCELASNLPCSSLLTGSSSLAVSAVIDCKRFSHLRRLLTITALVLRFTLKSKGREPRLVPVDITAEDILEAEELWIRDIQIDLTSSAKSKNWEGEFGVFSDPNGILRCGGRLGNADLSESQKHPALLDANHHVTSLIVRACHERVHHNGVKKTLTELRSRFWIVRGRQVVKKLLNECTICRRLQGKPYSPTFVSASKMLRALFNSPTVRRHLANKGIRWTFNRERAPWWGGYFERLVQSVKRCLKKILKNAKVTRTVLVETEATLNSRPLTFVSSGEIEKPLTP